MKNVCSDDDDNSEFELNLDAFQWPLKAGHVCDDKAFREAFFPMLVSMAAEGRARLRLELKPLGKIEFTGFNGR